MAFSALISSVSMLSAEDTEGLEPLPPEVCIGFDGSFDFSVPGVYDWWIAEEVGCPNPGFHWTVVSCTSGETLDVRVSGKRSDGQQIDFNPEIQELREKYANLDTPPDINIVFDDLTALGAEPIVRGERLDPGKFCKTGTVSDEGEAKL